MDNIAVLIPCYNESKTIEKVVKDFRRKLPEATIYVYDNNSSDHTDVLAKKAGAVVRYEYQQGKGNVVRRMFQDINAKCYILVDGDDTYSVESAPEMVKRILEHNADMVVGDRLSSTYFSENKRMFHNFGNSIVRSVINHMFHSDVRDIMTGYRAFSFRFIKSFPVVSKGFEIETEMTIHSIDKNMYLENQIISYRDRPEGSISKLNTFSDGAKVIKTIFSLFVDYRPFQFFGFLSMILLIVAFILFAPVFHAYMLTGVVRRFPTLIVCGFITMIAIISFFSGLILSMNKHHERREFEFKLQAINQWYNNLIKKDN